MTQNTQTTAERIRNLIFDAIQDSPYGDESIVAAPLGVTIAAEIDALTAERDTLRRTLNETMRQMGQFKGQAAEISRLTAEVASKQETIDMLLEDERDAFRHERAQLEAQLAEARAQVIEANTNAAYARTHEESLRIHKASLIKQLAEARAEVMKWRKELTLCNQERFDAQAQLAASQAEAERLQVAQQSDAAYLADYAKKIERMGAEVERLRLPAEAWEAQEAWTAAFRWPPDRMEGYEERHEAALMAYGAAAARARAAKVTQP